MAKCVPDAGALRRWLDLIPAKARYGPEVGRAPSYCYTNEGSLGLREVIELTNRALASGMATRLTVAIVKSCKNAQD
jgi:hypothetical protein